MKKFLLLVVVLSFACGQKKLKSPDNENEYILLQTGAYEKLHDIVLERGVRNLDLSSIEYTFPDSLTTIRLDMAEDQYLHVWSYLPGENPPYSPLLFYYINKGDTAVLFFQEPEHRDAIRPIVDDLMFVM